MNYTNQIIKRLVAERDALIEKYNKEIRKEIAKEKALRKINWKWVFLLVASVTAMVVFRELNKHIFPPTSIWSWAYYGF